MPPVPAHTVQPWYASSQQHSADSHIVACSTVPISYAGLDRDREQGKQNPTRQHQQAPASILPKARNVVDRTQHKSCLCIFAPLPSRACTTRQRNLPTSPLQPAPEEGGPRGTEPSSISTCELLPLLLGAHLHPPATYVTAVGDRGKQRGRQRPQ